MAKSDTSSAPVGGAECDVLRAVSRAAELARSIRAATPLAHQKHDLTPLTVADLAVQAVVTGTLERAFPGEPLVAEEDPSMVEGRDGGRLAAETVQPAPTPPPPTVTTPTTGERPRTAPAAARPSR